MTFRGADWTDSQVYVVDLPLDNDTSAIKDVVWNGMAYTLALFATVKDNNGKELSTVKHVAFHVGFSVLLANVLIILISSILYTVHFSYL